jgi:S1-C subfamily serine protease
MLMSCPIVVAALLMSCTLAASQEGGHLSDLEKKTRAVAAKLLPTVVGVWNPAIKEAKGPRGSATGVIISEDGLIVSQYHVSHRKGAKNWGDAWPKGTRTVVVFSDGAELEAELLGADMFNDLSMLRLTKPGKYPYAKFDGPAAKLGDTIVKIGHPNGYQVGRTPPVRLGRIIAVAEPVFVTDCLCIGGDSGGPYFDLDGRLVGIIRNSFVPESIIGTADAARSRGLFPFSVTPVATVRAKLDDLREGKIFGSLNPETAESRRFESALKSTDSLPAARWSQGASTLTDFWSVVSASRKSVVTVLEGDDAVALGTVVEKGFVLTRATQLPESPICRLPDGIVVEATVVGIDPAFDLALLRIKADAVPVEWADSDPPLGSLLAAPGPGEIPVAVGVVSVARRDIKVTSPASVTRMPRAPATVPAVLGSAVEGRGYWVEYVRGAAAAAGIRPGDVIVSIAGTKIREHSDLAVAVSGRRVSERVPVALLREGKPTEVTLKLTGSGFWMGLENGRAEGYPTVFEHDLPLLPAECGGPVVGLDGRTVGVTIARNGIHGCQAIPADVIRRLIPILKTGKPLASLPPMPKTAAPSTNEPVIPGKPVTESFEEIKRHLSERGTAFRSLCIEYETTTEPLIDPRVLASWGHNMIRDLKERHRIAFAGSKRLSELTRPGVLVYAIPPNEVTPDASAPPETVRLIKDRRRIGDVNELTAGVAGWFAGMSKDPVRTKSLFDGKDAYVSLLQGPNQKFIKVDADLYTTDSQYLAGLGLRPADPKPRTEVRESQAKLWFPDNFAGYDEVKVRPTTEAVDGAACVVLEATFVSRMGDRKVKQTEIFWLDPAINCSPRKWETRQDGVLLVRRTNARFEEFAPGCWLPWEAAVEHGPPAWVASSYRDRPAFRNVLRLQTARINNVPDALFTPGSSISGKSK